MKARIDATVMDFDGLVTRDAGFLSAFHAHWHTAHGAIYELINESIDQELMDGFYLKAHRKDPVPAPIRILW